MRKQDLVPLCALATALSSVASAQTTLSTINDPAQGAIEVLTGTIQPAGPRPAPLGLRFFNFQGDDAGANSSYGIARFDLTRVRNQFNSIFGNGRWRVSGLTLELTQDNAAFTADGRFFIEFTPDDTSDINTVGVSPFRYQTPAPEGQIRITQHDFVGLTTGTVDTINLFTGTPGARAAAVDIQNDNTLTLVFNPDNVLSPFVAATYRGQIPTISFLAPQLVVTAERNDGTQPAVLSTLADRTDGSNEVLSAQIRSTGPLTGSGGDNFLNILGDNQTAATRCYGILRFDLTRIRSQFNATYGAGNWRVRNVDLRMTQSNFAQTANGTVIFSHTTDDTTNIKTAASPFRYPSPQPAGQTVIRTFNFVRNDDTTDVINLFGPSRTGGGADVVANDIRTDNTLTLVISPDNANTPGVGATYRGQNPSIITQFRYGPKLNITAVAASAVQGTLNWENTGSDQTVTFTFQPTSGSPIVVPVKVGPNGTYTVGGLPFGTYTVTIQAPTYLRKVVSGVNTTSGTATLNVTLLGGDANGDNAVDVFDLADLISSFDKSVGDAGFLAGADFNNDGSVDVLDLDVLVRNFDQSGD